MLPVPVADADSTAPDDPIVLADEIARMAAHLDAATHRLLGCIRRFDESGEWAKQGLVSCAHWLSWRIGLDPGTAREKVRVARALGALPKIDDALRRGTLSYAKVRAVTRVATPENEACLLEIALATTGAQLERVCRRFRRVLDTDGGERLHERRFVRDEALPSGLVRVTAVLHPDEAALVMKAIEMARLQADSRSDDSAETREPGGSQMLPAADALTRVAESFLAHGEAQGCGGDRYQIVVHLDQDPLAADGARAATLDDGTRVSAERSGASPATPDWYRYFTARVATARRSAARHAPFPPRSDAPCGPGMAAASSPAAPTVSTFTPITSTTGRTAAPPAPTTWSCSAPPTTAWSTRVASGSRALAAPSNSAIRTAASSTRTRRRCPPTTGQR